MYLITQFECALSGTHKEVSTCICGENRICYRCGYGAGNIPCSCSRPIILGISPEGDIEWQRKPLPIVYPEQLTIEAS